ncbi:hypothetical protein KP509_23G001100 [Ceratopteris richardii]|uniref:AB hydrolase-1 domain-containing protein n=1 Tax=Ceratopteris richardii TaxID=49495 RepID=A0A8T2RWM2_CERRI|nr:hypothetical protein KP509_23G001100 [Ceratopteris richardii]
MAGLECKPSANRTIPALSLHSFHQHASLAVPITFRRHSISLRASPKQYRFRHGIVPHSLVESKAAVAESRGEQLFQLQEGQSRSSHQLPSGLKIEVIEHPASSSVEEIRPPLVFLHGSYHAAWCWAVNWLPFFASQGYDCFALSFLGQGHSDIPASRIGGTLQTHARDVAHFIKSRALKAPVLVGHSFGGLIVQHYLAHVATESDEPSLDGSGGWEEPYPVLAGAILACSVPPTGNGPAVLRYLMSRPIASIKVTLSLAAKLFTSNESLCKETFFSADMSPSLVQMYQKLLAESSKVPLINLRELNASLPVSPPSKNAPPTLIIGAENDFILDMQGNEETAKAYGNNLLVLPATAHDIMLDIRWRDAAEAVHFWLKENCSHRKGQAKFQVTSST